MNKSSKKAGPRHSLRDRILAHIMIVLITITMLPYQSLAVRAASTQTVKSVGGVKTEYEVDNGTSKDEIGLPSSLSAVIETTTAVEGATNGETTTSEETVDKSVSWEGNYDGNAAGTYALTAKFDDSSLSYGNMPTVHVTVREKETTSEGASNEAGKTEDAEDGDDDGESDQPAQSEEEPAVEEPAAEEPAAEEPAKQEKAEEEEEEEIAEEEAASKEAQKEAQPGNTITGREESNLNLFGDNMSVTLTLPNGDPITEDLHAGDLFNVKLDFHETAGGIQFNMDTLRYTLPNGAKAVPPLYGDSTVTVRVIDQETGHEQWLDLTTRFTIEQSDDPDVPDVIVYEWNHSPLDNYLALCDAENVRVSMSLQMQVNGEGNNFEFEDDTLIPVDLTVRITVIKAVQINGTHSLTEAEKDQMEFAIFEGDGSTGVRAKDKNGNVIPTFSLADMTALENSQWKKEFSGLVKGTYTVKEISGLTIQDYTFSTSSVTEATQTIPASDERTFNLTNIYVQDSGDLVLKKNFASGSALNGSNMTTAQKQAITFTVTGPNGFNHVYTYDQIYSNGGALTLNDLPVGTYHVVEASNIPGYECTSTSYEVKVDGTSTGSGNNNAAVDVVNDKESEVTYTNNYKQQTGSLKLTKAFEGDGVTDALKNQLTFTITGPNNYSRTVTYAEIASGSVTITDLPVGSYTITENRGNNIPTGTQVQTYIGTSTSPASSPFRTTVTVPNNGTGSATYRNVYTKVGSLKITKTVTGDRTYAQIRDKSSKAYVIVTGPNGYNSGRINIQSSTFGSSGTYTISNLPVGDYTVTEYNGNYSTSYTLTTTYDGSVSGTGTSTPGTSTVPQGGTGEEIGRAHV